MVASRADAWIETCLLCRLNGGDQSRPARTRGLKLNMDAHKAYIEDVASRADAWIETATWYDALANYAVASRADAWIETRNPSLLNRYGWVASRADAWIETTSSGTSIPSACRVPRGRVD